MRYAVRMAEQYSTNLYPIGIASQSERCSHGWFVVTLDADGEVPADTPPVLALPLPLQADADYRLVIEEQCSHLRLMLDQIVVARIPCAEKESDVLSILASGRLGLAQVEDGFELKENTRLKIDHKAEIDMLPFYDEYLPRLAVLKERDPAAYDDIHHRMEAMPAWQTAKQVAAKRPDPVEISADQKDAIWRSVIGNKSRQPLKQPSGSSLKDAIMRGKSED